MIIFATGRWRRSAIVAAAVLAATALTLAGQGVAVAASGPVRIVGSHPNHLVGSTGNLYWTETAGDDGSNSYTASVHRMSKDVVPGTPTELYRETRTGSFDFGHLTYANVGGTWFGYFVANYGTQSRIKRIPLAGGAAVTLMTSTAVIGNRDLVTDDSWLYWADPAGLKRMPIGGGAVTSLATGTDLSFVGLDGSRVFFSAGSSLRSVPKGGGPVTTQVVGASAVTAMFVRSVPYTTIFWGEKGGAVKGYSIGLGTSTYQAPVAGRYVHSLSYDGSRVLWSDCTAGTCNVRKWQSGTTSSVALLSYYPLNVLGDATAMFWSGTYGIFRYTH